TTTTAICFFFQAEDGIRDRNVTGIQTCALPICGSRGAIFNGDSHRAYNFNAPVPGQEGEERPIIQTGASAEYLGTVTLRADEERSEERRVAKEWGGGRVGEW